VPAVFRSNIISLSDTIVLCKAICAPTCVVYRFQATLLQKSNNTNRDSRQSTGWGVDIRSTSAGCLCGCAGRGGASASGNRRFSGRGESGSRECAGRGLLARLCRSGSGGGLRGSLAPRCFLALCSICIRIAGAVIVACYDALLSRAHTGPVIRSTVVEDGLSRPEAGLDNILGGACSGAGSSRCCGCSSRDSASNNEKSGEEAHVGMFEGIN